MRAGAILALAAFALAAQPRLLTNAKVDSRSAAAGLDREFRSLLAEEPQPAWIGWTVPSVRTYSLGCEYVSHDGWSAPGVVHLEPPDHAVILFRVESGAVDRIRVLSPDCEIDAAGAPLHWLDDVRPADSAALLQSFTVPEKPAGKPNDRSEPLRESAVFALSVSAEPAALETLIALARKDDNPRIRRACVSALARSADPRATAFFNEVLGRR